MVYGNDKLVRSAELNTANGPTNRPIHKLYPLEVVSKEIANAAHIPDVTTKKADDATPRRSTRDAAVAARIRIADIT